MCPTHLSGLFVWLICLAYLSGLFVWLICLAYLSGPIFIGLIGRYRGFNPCWGLEIGQYSQLRRCNGSLDATLINNPRGITTYLGGNAICVPAAPSGHLAYIQHTAACDRRHQMPLFAADNVGTNRHHKISRQIPLDALLGISGKDLPAQPRDRKPRRNAEITERQWLPRQHLNRRAMSQSARARRALRWLEISRSSQPKTPNSRHKWL